MLREVEFPVLIIDPLCKSTCPPKINSLHQWTSLAQWTDLQWLSSRHQMRCWPLWGTQRWFSRDLPGGTTVSQGRLGKSEQTQSQVEIQLTEAQSRRLLLLEGGLHFFFFNFSFSGQYCIHIAQNLKGTTGYTPECFPSVLPLDTRSFSQRQAELQVLECLFRPVLCVTQMNTQRTPFFHMKSSALALFTVCDRSLSICKSFALSFTTGEYSSVRMYFYLASSLSMDM